MQFARRYCAESSALRKPYTFRLLSEQCVADTLACVTKLGVAPPERLIDLFCKCFQPYSSGHSSAAPERVRCFRVRD